MIITFFVTKKYKILEIFLSHRIKDMFYDFKIRWLHRYLSKIKGHSFEAVSCGDLADF